MRTAPGKSKLEFFQTLTQRVALPAKPKTLSSISPPVARFLRQLRRRIRMIVLAEGLLAMVVALLICFWVAYALDYLPVTFGFAELSRPARIVLLSATVLVGLFQLYRYVGRRLFVSLSDSSLALLIEKKHPEFEESLLTTVNSVASGCEAMLKMTRKKAESIVSQLAPGQIVGFHFLRTRALLGSLLLASLIALGVANFDHLRLAVSRLCMLQNQPWPRRVYLELTGLKIRTRHLVPGIEELGQTLRPRGNSFRVPRGASLVLAVRAQDVDPLVPWRRLPESCVIHYRNSEGEQGTQALNRIGRPGNGWQRWSLSGSPLDAVIHDFEFTIRGDDFCDGPYRIEVTDPAIVTGAHLDCVYPDYLSENDSLSWTPRTIRWTGRASLPAGTSFHVRGTATKPLTRVYALDTATSLVRQGEVDGETFQFAVEPVSEALNLRLYLVDGDHLVSDIPYPISVEPIPDQPPEVVARLVGIGTAVTPNAMLPFEGLIEDDYGVQETWIELQTPRRKLPPAVQTTSAGGKLEAAIDLAELVRVGVKLDVDDGSELGVIIKAKDFYALHGESPNVGVGDRYSLELVSPNRLLRMLERIEVSQRRRLEQIFEEVAGIRGYLSRTRKRRDVGDAAIREPGDQEAGHSDEVLRQQALRIVFSQRSKLQASKAAQEIDGIGAAFENLRLQLINNRIDAEDRKQRLATQVIAPLQAITENSLSTLANTIDELEVTLKQIDRGIGGVDAEANAGSLTDRAQLETSVVLKEIEAVLAVLIKYETQNELLEIVRRMISEQEALIERTREQRQKEAFEGLLD